LSGAAAPSVPAEAADAAVAAAAASIGVLRTHAAVFGGASPPHVTSPTAGQWMNPLASLT
jgi:hypothetical protein